MTYGDLPNVRVDDHYLDITDTAQLRARLVTKDRIIRMMMNSRRRMSEVAARDLPSAAVLTDLATSWNVAREAQRAPEGSRMRQVIDSAQALIQLLGERDQIMSNRLRLRAVAGDNLAQAADAMARLFPHVGDCDDEFCAAAAMLRDLAEAYRRAR